MSTCRRLVTLLLICQPCLWAPLTDSLCAEDPEGIDEELVNPEFILVSADMAKDNGGPLIQHSYDDTPAIPSPVVTRDLKEPFDAREVWKKCTSISHIWNQGNCNVCFMVVAVALITDHLCIWDDRETTKWISAGQAAACRTNPQSDRANCLNGGTIETIFARVAAEGINTGGPKKSYGGCAPYLIPTWKSRCTNTDQTIACQPKCRDGHGVSMARDKYAPDYGVVNSAEQLAMVTEMKKAIIARGPIGAAIVVSEGFGKFDFGKDAVKKAYVKPQNAKELGGHAVRIVGWTMCQDKVECWIIANSWGTKWGDKGFGYVAVSNSGTHIETAVSSPVFHHPEAPKENACNTARFCGLGPIDQAIPSNAMDPDAPFYLIQGGCVQQVVFQKAGLVTVGKAVAIQWVFPQASISTGITRYTLISDTRTTKTVSVPFLGAWIYDAKGGAVYCRPVTDGKFSCPNPKDVRSADKGPAARAMYYESGLKSLSYDHAVTPAKFTIETITVPPSNNPPVTIIVPEVIFKKYGKINSLLYVGSQNIAIFGTTGINGAGNAFSGIYTFANGHTLEEVQPAKKKPLTCV